MAGIYQRELPNAPVFTPSRGYNNVDFGVDSFMKAGALLGNALGGVREKELENAKIAREAERYKWEQDRFAREQELNKRQDLEYNREIGLRDMRKDLAAEYEANPYADVWGGGAANKMLDKQVLDYVGSGKEITPEIATRLQGLYETNRPFKEDLAQVFTNRMIAAGEDPSKAGIYSKTMTDHLPFSRVTQQAQLDKQQELQQKVYDANADARLEALKLNKDADKINANNATEVLKSRISSGFSGMGGGTGGGSKGTAPGGYSNLTADEMSLSWMPAFTRMGDEKETQDIINGLQAKSVPSGIARKALDESVVTKNGDRYVDKNLLKTNVDRYMGMYSQTGAGGTGTTTVNADVNPKDLLAQFAPRQIAGYNPEGMLERAKTVVPELFSGVVKSEQVSNEGTVVNSIGKGNTLADQNFNPGNIKYTGIKWQGGSEGKGGFVKFDTPEEGARALAKTIINGGVGKTVDQYINKYAPESDGNETSSYVKQVAAAIGKKPDQVIRDEDVPAIMKAITKREGGSFSDEVLNKGYDLATKSIKDTKQNTTEPDNKLTGTPLINKNTTTGEMDLNEDVLQARKEAFNALYPDTVVSSNKGTKGTGAIDAFNNVGSVKERRKVLDSYPEKVRGILDANGGGMLDEFILKQRLKTEGLSAEEADVAIIKGKALLPEVKERSDRNIARRNELINVHRNQDGRQKIIAEKYATNPLSLTPNERIWIEGNKQTPNGRLLLESLGIE